MTNAKVANDVMTSRMRPQVCLRTRYAKLPLH